MRMMDKHNQILVNPDLSAPIGVDVKVVTLSKKGVMRGKVIRNGVKLPVVQRMPGVWVMVQ